MEKQTTMPVRWVLVHPGFHLDEVKAVWLLRRFGEDFFPGIADAKIIFKLRDVEGITQEQMEWSAQQLLEQLGVLCVGCLGDRGALFDEHGEKRKGGKSACMLVAEHLNVANHPDVRDTLAFVDQFDRQGHASERKTLQGAHGRTSSLLVEHDVRAVLRAKHRNDESNDCVMVWALDVLETLIERKKRIRLLDSAVSRECVPKRKVSIGGQKVHVWLVRTQEHDAPSIAFRKGAKVVIVRRESGHAVIINQGKQLNMVPVLSAIRAREAVLQGWVVAAGDMLNKEHSESVPNWDFHPPTGNIFNTDEQKVLDVVPTALSDDELLETVAQNLVFL